MNIATVCLSSFLKKDQACTTSGKTPYKYRYIIHDKITCEVSDGIVVCCRGVGRLCPRPPDFALVVVGSKFMARGTLHQNGF